jgi:hypothetical protein
VFHTGDLGRIQPDGILEFLCRAGGTGRPDKTGPTPVEIAGIESALRGYPGVRDALVITSHDDHNDGALVGYLVTYDGGAVDGQAIRSYLSSRLPDQLMPIGFVSLDSLPRNRAGKIDRTRLRRPALAETSTKDTALPSFGAAKSAFGTGDPQAPSGPATRRHYPNAQTVHRRPKKTPSPPTPTGPSPSPSPSPSSLHSQGR